VLEPLAVRLGFRRTFNPLGRFLSRDPVLLPSPPTKIGQLTPL
jgi:hypothetical protein